jgi:amino acid transporter
LPIAVALDRLLPTRFTSVDQRGTPRTAVLLSAGLYSTFALLPFAELVVLDFFVYGMVLVLQLASLVVLRNRDPGLRGAFRIPLRVGGIVLLAALPTSLLVVAIVFEIAQRGLDGWPLRVTVAGTIIGIVLYFTTAYFSRRKPYAVSG